MLVHYLLGYRVSQNSASLLGGFSWNRDPFHSEEYVEPTFQKLLCKRLRI